jgi:hypothetical protein
MPRTLIRSGEVHETAAFAENARRYFHEPGTVVAFYPGSPGVSPPTVDVQPAVNDVRFCIQDGVPAQPQGKPALVAGQRYSEPWPVLPRVPVAFYQFGGLAIWGPIRPGDKVTLISYDLDPSQFMATGQQSDPPMTRRNSGTHWVAIPGDITDGSSLGDPGPNLCIGSPNGILVAIGPSGVLLGSANPTDAVARASVVDSVWNGLAQALASAPPTVPLTPAALLALLQTVWGGAPSLPAAPPTTSASQTVKCTP